MAWSRLKIELIFGSAFLLCHANAQTAWVQWTVAEGGNGDWFRSVYVPDGISWTQAYDNSLADGGNLASITSAAENSFVFSLVDNVELWSNGGQGPSHWFGPWLGGVAPDPRPYPDYGWSWTDGSPFIYSDWATGEPNNANGDETHLQFASYTGSLAMTWNDLDDTGSNIFGEVYSYVEQRNSAPTPGPAAALPFVAGFFVRRRRSTVG